MKRENILLSVGNRFRAEYDKQYHEYNLYTAAGKHLGRFKVDNKYKNGELLIGTASNMVGISCNEMAELRRLCQDVERNLALGTDAYEDTSVQCVKPISNR